MDIVLSLLHSPLVVAGSLSFLGNVFIMVLGVLLTRRVNRIAKITEETHRIVKKVAKVPDVQRRT